MPTHRATNSVVSAIALGLADGLRPPPDGWLEAVYTDGATPSCIVWIHHPILGRIHYLVVSGTEVFLSAGADCAWFEYEDPQMVDQIQAALDRLWDKLEKSYQEPALPP